MTRTENWKQNDRDIMKPEFIKRIEPFFINVDDIDNDKNNNANKSGYIIRPEWNNKAIRKDIFEKISSELDDTNNLENTGQGLWNEEKERELQEINILMKSMKEEMGALKLQIAKLKEEIKQENNLEEQEIKIEGIIQETIDQVEDENEEKIKENIKELVDPINKDESTKIATSKIYQALKRKMVKYVILPAGVAVTLALSYHNPREYYGMYQNYKERHWEKFKKDDPNIIGINNLYNDTTDIKKTTYDFLGEHKIEYKGGYYITSVFDLSDKTPPKFKLINDRENYSKMDSAAGITTNLFKRFQKFDEFNPELKGHENKNEQEKGNIAVIGYDIKNRIMRAGHYKDFDENWLVSETYEIPLDFKLNPDSTINLVYHGQAMRMVPLTTNETGKQIPFPIGITYDKNIQKIKPQECTHFGTLEGGKVIMVCGNKQLQVNGSFSDMFIVYKRLKSEFKNAKVQAFLLDNGSYNLPIWDKDSTITPQEIKKHLLRNYDGGTALVLINDESISPYEYKSRYKEYEHYTPNYTLDSITGKPAKNQKSVIVLHHTGFYRNSNDIIKQFENTASGTSAHVLILKDGTRHLFNTDNYVLAHAGKSYFNNENKVNYFSLGIELEGDSKNNHQFTVAQLESMLEYLRPRIEKYHIPLDNITTHKIIRDNYMNKFPQDKEAETKRDLDDEVWKQIRDLIAKKLYNNKHPIITKPAEKMIGMLEYRDSYRKYKNKNDALAQTKVVLNRYNNINTNRVTDWINSRV